MNSQFPTGAYCGLNIGSYSLLTLMIHRPTGEFVHTLGDAHLYLNLRPTSS